MYDFFVTIVTIRLVFLLEVFLVEAFMKVSLGNQSNVSLKKNITIMIFQNFKSIF